MKIRRLPEIDLARICALPVEKKKSALERFKSGYSLHSYNPMRAMIPDILNIQYPLFPDLQPHTSWEKIESVLRQKCRNVEESDYNIQVASLLHEYGLRNDIRSFSKPVPQWAIGFGQAVKYWWDVYSVIGDSPYFVFVDPRVSSPLTGGGIRFTLSVMNERLRVPDPDFADAKLIVCQFPKMANGVRQMRVYDADDFALHSSSDLDEMIGETYSLWLEVLRGREKSARHRAHG